MRKILFLIAATICIGSLAACSATPAVKNASSAAASQAAASPSVTVTFSAPASPASSISAGSSDASTASPAGSDEDPGYTLENIIKEDSLNKNYQNTPVPGETIQVTIVRNTLTFNVTLNENIKPEEFTVYMRAKYKQDLQNQIDMLSQEYDGLIDCTFIYNLMNKSGTKLMTLTQDFKYQAN